MVKKPATALTLVLMLCLSFSALAGRCSGGANCTACTTCNYCKNCAEQGGSCSVCAGYDEPGPASVPVEQEHKYASELNNSDNEFYLGRKEREKSGSGWFWWIAGIIGGIFLLGFIGKK